MNKLKKTLAVLVCMAMALTFVPAMTVSAEDYVEGKTDNDLEYITYNDHVVITGYTGKAAELDIPDEIEGLPVTVICEYAFAYCRSLTSVTIPGSVTSIIEDAFAHCYSLTNIIVEDNNSCYCDINGVLFDKDAKTLIQYPIGNPRNTYAIPSGVTSIGEDAFKDCDSLTSVTIPDSVTIIGTDAFVVCDSLASVTIPDSVTSIGVGAFACCTSLTNVIIGNGVTNIGESAFEFCTSLTSVTIGDGVMSIGDYAFLYCNSLTSVTIPDSVTSIGDCAFQECDSLASVTIPDSVTSIGADAFACCTSLTNVIIGNGVTNIGESAFEFCTSLTSVTIGDGVTSIGDYAFYYCESLTSVTIGNGVTSIGDLAFYYCNSLTDVYYTGSESQWENILIGDDNDELLNAVIHYNSKMPTAGDKYAKETSPFVSAADSSHKGDTEADVSGGNAKPYYNNLVNAPKTIDGDLIIRNSSMTVYAGTTTVNGDIIIENGSLYINDLGNISANNVKIGQGGKIENDGDLRCKNVSISGNGALKVNKNSAAYTDDICVEEQSKIFISGKVYAHNFTISTSSTENTFASTGELWIGGDFSQKHNGALWWANGRNNFTPENGFTVILSGGIGVFRHYIHFDDPGQSYMYNMYLEKGQDNSYDNQWSGNPEIRGFQRNIYKSGNGYKLTPLSQAEREAFAKQLNAELKKAMDESKKSVKIGYGISEFGAMNSSTNEALKEYLYAYIAGMEAIYPSVVNISTRSWPETIPVYYNGNYHDVKFTFKIADIEHQRVAEVRYTYGSSIDKQCYVFMISDGKMLAESIKKYAYSTYDSAMADYFMVPLNQYIKDKNSKLASLLWNGVKDLQINGWGLNIDGGKKYVKDYFKKGVDKYLDSIEKVVRTAGIEEVNIMSAEKEAPYAPVAALPENVAEPFSDEYFVEALKGKLNVDELTPEILADVTELDLSESYITEISGIEQCANLQSLNLAGNAVSDLRPLAGLTRLEELDLSGNSVSDLTPISGLESLTSLTLKNNLISDLSGLEGAAALSELDLAFNYISDITNISGLTKLTSLNLTDNNISNISALTNITALKTLYLGENNVAEVICYERGIRNRP